VSLPLLERDVTRQCCDLLKAEGWRLIRHNVTKVPMRGQWVSFGEKGMPDWQAIYYLGSFSTLTLWLEFKQRGKGRLREEQLAWRLAEEKRGACVWRVDDYDEFRSLYREAFDYPGSPVKAQRQLLASE
jgi:hypothetical protein